MKKKILLASLERNRLRNQPFDYSEELYRIREKALESIRQYKDLKKE